MSRRLLLAALAFSPLAFFAVRPAAAVPGGCGNLFPNEPLVLFDTTGFTLSGSLIHQNLVVYGSGIAAYSVSSQQLTPPLEGSFDFGDAKVAMLTPETAQRFLRELAFAGAFSLCDEPAFVADVPPSTLTVFNGGTDAAAHSFSFFGGGLSQPHATVAQIVDAFITAHFPGM